ncbi:hypothetical protein BC831DRAFT_471340 [Entophlyctis helioformis]|nr:hypothetical protein BC831DRAFT_471340 [Entophlyctis helioformis]
MARRSAQAQDPSSVSGHRRTRSNPALSPDSAGKPPLALLARSGPLSAPPISNKSRAELAAATASMQEQPQQEPQSQPSASPKRQQQQQRQRRSVRQIPSSPEMASTGTPALSVDSAALDPGSASVALADHDAASAAALPPSGRATRSSRDGAANVTAIRTQAASQAAANASPGQILTLESESSRDRPASRSRRNRQHRKHHSIIMSDSSDMDISDVERSSKTPRTSKASKRPNANKDKSSSLAPPSAELPTEERPYQDLLPDLEIASSMPLLLFDCDELPERQNGLESRETDQPQSLELPSHNFKLLASGNGINEAAVHAIGILPPAQLSLPELPKDAFKTVPAPSYRHIDQRALPTSPDKKQQQGSQPSQQTTRVSRSSSALQSALRKQVPLPSPYARYLEPSEDKLAERVEYDMDEQDRAWLAAVNAEHRKQGQRECSEDLFELIMDHIEKEWFDLTKDLPKAGREETPYPEDISCAVCDDGEAENSNAIVFCDGCNLAVHQDCYGVPFIPEGQWLCRKCMLSPETPVSCIFCPIEGGAFKKTSTNRWAHLHCAMWIPECQIANTVYMEPIEGVENIPRSRWRLVCYICKKRHGAPIQCSNKSCFTAFHPSCARKAKLFMRMRGQNNTDANSFRSFCDKHTPREYRETVDIDATLHAAQEGLSRIRLPVQPRKRKPAASVHADSDDDPSSVTVASSSSQPLLGSAGSQRKRKRVGEESEDDAMDGSMAAPKTPAARAASDSGKTDVLASTVLQMPDLGSLSAAPPAAAKTISAHSSPVQAPATPLSSSAKGLSSTSSSRAPAPSRQTAVALAAPATPSQPSPILSLSAPVIPYYILYQVSQTTAMHQPRKKLDLIIKIARYWALKRESRRGAALLKRLHLEPWTAATLANKEDEENKIRKYERLGVLRRDFERVRTLVEMVRKREKEKEKIYRALQEYVEKLTNPLLEYLRSILQQLKSFDKQGIFAYPVDPVHVPDYLEYIKNPMDFSTMSEKLESFQYLTVEDFQRDLDLIVDNCLLYNKPETIYAKTAVRLRKFAVPIMGRLAAHVAATMTDHGVLDVQPDLSILTE